jgi:hypothetical protein
LSEVFHRVFHSSRLEALREAFAEEFRRGILRESDFTADPSFELEGVPEPTPLVPLNENSEGVIDGTTYRLHGEIAFIGKLGRVNDRDYGGAYSSEKILMYVFPLALEYLPPDRYIDVVVEGTLWGAGRKMYRCFGRFEVLKRENPERFIHLFKAGDIEVLLQHWQADLPHILSSLSDWSERATSEEKNQIADYFNFFGARRLKGYLEKWNQLPPLPTLGRAVLLRDAFEFLLAQIHPEVALVILEHTNLG